MSPMNPRLMRPLAKRQAPASNWASVLNSTYAANITSAYDFRDISGNILPSKIGPAMTLDGVTKNADGGVFVSAAPASIAYATSSVSVTYPTTIVFVAKANAAGGELVYFGLASENAGRGMNPQVRFFSRPSQSLMPYNSTDNQQTTYLPNGSEWFFAAASFLGDGSVRAAVRAASGNINITLDASVEDDLDAFPNVGEWFGTRAGFDGTMRLAMSINQGFDTTSAMNALFATIQTGPASDLL